MQEQWDACSAAIAARMPEQAYKTWIKPLAFLEFSADDCLIRLGAATQIKADIVRNQYQNLIQEVLRDVIDPAMRVEIGVAPRTASAAPVAGAGAATHAGPSSAGPSSFVSSGPSHPGSMSHGVQSPAPHGGGQGNVPAGMGNVAAGAGSYQGGMASPHGAGAFQPQAHVPQQTHERPGHGPGYGGSQGWSDGGAEHAGHPGFEARHALEAPDVLDDGTGDYLDDGSDPEGPGDDGSTNAPARSFGGLGGQMPNERSRLNPGLTFAAFVNGKANDLARAAALQVADRPGSAYNPLFIHGGVGLGKTHLMQAVGNAIQQRESRAIIRYISSNQFVQDLIQAIRRNAIDRFKHYYQSLDVLLIDDIQFLSDKQRSQEEFFHVFETMTINQRQIVITCDTYPKELKGIDDRLISRLNSGLIVAIEPPELEMRVAILQRKAEQARIRLPDDVAYFIAKNIRRNVRELEGALQRAIHYASFRSSPLTLELVKEALKDLISFNRGQISIDFIQKTVAEYYKIKQADMYSKRKPAKIALPRQIAMYLAKELTQKSLPEIGDAFGGKDHTTVLYAVRKITELRAHDEDLNKQIHVLDQTLREYL
ncbi:chromosomal replication initiator protein DnaA [Lautropia mirabilis]|uniref:chromosomal replication initiator protein DnaA n=1 Tax=Lautropia mirabilis TaxID=47671 RepID=UPI002349A9E0|nr:chromosomal replication initiator protein DnaA [Lautropia mirabilis]MDC6094452.1 chromosomal replication initiator protein DnaA [Lautropia mirabilis]